MRKCGILAVAALLGAISVPGDAQEKPKAESGEKQGEVRAAITPLRVQVVFNEFEGDKKIGSLPYTMLVNSDRGGPLASIRVGLRVPIHTKDSAQVQYVDMGTNMDGRAERLEDGRFLLSLSVERSSAYSPQGNLPDSKTGSSDTPVIQQFRSQLNLVIRDGQTIQSTVSTDPVTGRVTKVDVTVNVVK